LLSTRGGNLPNPGSARCLSTERRAFLGGWALHICKRGKTKRKTPALVEGGKWGYSLSGVTSAPIQISVIKSGRELVFVTVLVARTAIKRNTGKDRTKSGSSPRSKEGSEKPNPQSNGFSACGENG